MKAAQVALQQNNRGMALGLLRRYLPNSNEEDLRGIEWRYLWQESRGEEAQSFSHATMVSTATLSPDGRYLATAQLNGHIVVWSVGARTKIQEFEGRAVAFEAGNAVAFSPDGAFLALLGRNGVQVRDTASWKLVRELESSVTPVCFSPKGGLLITGGTNGLLVVSSRQSSNGRCHT